MVFSPGDTVPSKWVRSQYIAKELGYKVEKVIFVGIRIDQNDMEHRAVVKKAGNFSTNIPCPCVLNRSGTFLILI